MIEINLLPGSGKKKAARGQAVDFGALLTGFKERTRDKFLIGAVAATVIAAAAGGWLFWQQTSRDRALRVHLDKSLKDSTKYARIVHDRFRAEATRDTLLRQVNLIKSLDEDRFVWPHIMDEVSRVLPQYTWLSTLGFVGTAQGSTNVVASPKPPPADTTKKVAPKRLDTEVVKDQINIRLTGLTVDIEAVTRFMRDLEASPMISGVTLERSELAIVSGKEVFQFQLTMTYTRPDPATIQRVPFNIVGR
jgi:Tfp pilus assembly protein PilN